MDKNCSKCQAFGFACPHHRVGGADALNDVPSKKWTMHTDVQMPSNLDIETARAEVVSMSLEIARQYRDVILPHADNLIGRQIEVEIRVRAVKLPTERARSVEEVQQPVEMSR